MSRVYFLETAWPDSLVREVERKSIGRERKRARPSGNHSLPQLESNLSFNYVNFEVYCLNSSVVVRFLETNNSHGRNKNWVSRNPFSSPRPAICYFHMKREELEFWLLTVSRHQ